MTIKERENENENLAIVIKNGDFYWEETIDDENEKNKNGKNQNQKIGESTISRGGISNPDSIHSSLLVKVNTPLNDKEANTTLKGINLEIKKGEFVVIIGGNSSGKSTLLYSILSETKCSSPDTSAWMASEACLVS